MSRILIVDDEPSMRKILAANLVQDGHVVTEARGLAEAKACLSANQFDACITDQKMPDGQGSDVLRLGPRGRSGVIRGFSYRLRHGGTRC